MPRRRVWRPLLAGTLVRAGGGALSRQGAGLWQGGKHDNDDD